MSSPVRFKASLYTVALFAAGAICGAVVAHQTAPPPQSAPLTLGRVDEIAAKIRAKFRTSLSLSPEQLTNAEPLIHVASLKLEAAHRDCLDQIDQIIRQLHHDLSSSLSEAQKTQLKTMETNRADKLWQEYRYRPGATN